MAEKSDDFINWVFLTDIDSLLDTRLGLISLHDQELAAHLLRNRHELYYSRTVERFGKWSTDEWIELYSKRSKRVVRESVPTNMMRLATGYMGMAEISSAGSPVPSSPVLYINTYPYELTEEEEDLLLKSMVVVSKGTINIEIVRMAYGDITPQWLRDNVAVYATYNFREWLEVQSMTDAFSRMCCPDVTILAPRVVFDESLENDTEIYGTIEKTFKPLFDLEYIPVEEFCIAVPEELDKK